MRKTNSILNDLEYQSALHEVSELIDNAPIVGSQEGIRFEILLKAIEDFEAENYPICSVHPQNNFS